MNWTTIEGRWKDLTADLKARWAKLTDDDVKLLGAKRDKLVGKIVERYGLLKDDAERQVDEWIREVDARLHGKPRGDDDRAAH